MSKNKNAQTPKMQVSSFVCAPLLRRVQILLFNGLCTIQNGYKRPYLQATCEQYCMQYTKTGSAAAQEPLINSRPQDISQNLNGGA